MHLAAILGTGHALGSHPGDRESYVPHLGYLHNMCRRLEVCHHQLMHQQGAHDQVIVARHLVLLGQVGVQVSQRAHRPACAAHTRMRVYTESRAYASSSGRTAKAGIVRMSANRPGFRVPHNMCKRHFKVQGPSQSQSHTMLTLLAHLVAPPSSQEGGYEDGHVALHCHQVLTAAAAVATQTHSRGKVHDPIMSLSH